MKVLSENYSENHLQKERKLGIRRKTWFRANWSDVSSEEVSGRAGKRTLSYQVSKKMQKKIEWKSLNLMVWMDERTEWGKKCSTLINNWKTLKNIESSESLLIILLALGKALNKNEYLLVPKYIYFSTIIEWIFWSFGQKKYWIQTEDWPFSRMKWFFHLFLCRPLSQILAESLLIFLYIFLYIYMYIVRILSDIRSPRPIFGDVISHHHPSILFVFQ